MAGGVSGKPSPNTTTPTQAKPSPNGRNTTAPMSYSNSGNQDIKGVSNQTGLITGDGNGTINLGNLTSSSAKDRAQQKLEAVKALAAVVEMIDADKTENAPPTPPPNPFPTPTYNNTGSQRIRGISNQTGIIDGHNNGTINY